MIDPEVARAQAFCIAAHCAVGQVRKYTGEPYYHHPIGVAELLTIHVPDCPRHMVIAALLHDVVEDTQVTLQVVQEQFGDQVAMLVYHLTDVSPVVDPTAPRKERKRLDREHIAKACPEAKTIKLCDLIHNTVSIAKHGSLGFAQIYLAEKLLLLDVLKDGDQGLYDLAVRTTDKALQSIAERES